MNLVCFTCQNPISCTNCQVKSTSPKPPVNHNKNNSNLIELTGILQRIGKKPDRFGRDFFFGALKLDDDTEQVVFFFDPDYNLLVRLNTLNEGDRIKVHGFVSKVGKFVVKELVDDNGSEIF